MISTFPDVWVEFFLKHSGDSATDVYGFSKRAIPHPGTYHSGFKDGRVEQYSDIVRNSSDVDGNYTAARFSMTLRDEDREIDTWLTTTARRVITNRECVVNLCSEEGWKAGVVPRTLFRGRLRDHSTDLLNHQFSFDDLIGAVLSPFNLERKLQQNRLTRAEFPALYRQFIGVMVQILAGEVSDLGTVDGDGLNVEKGLIPVQHVGAYPVPTYGDMECFVFMDGAPTKLIDVFGSDLAADTTPKRVKKTDDQFGPLLLAPNKPGWPFSSTYITSATGHRYGAIFASGALAQHHINGNVSLTVNACGMEPTGRGTGDVIDQAFYVWQHIICEFILQNNGKGYAGGDWLGIPYWASDPTVPMLQPTTFASAQADSATIMGTTKGYLSGFVLNEDITVREMMSRFCRSYFAFYYPNSHGQLAAFLLNHHHDMTSSKKLREGVEITRLPRPVWKPEQQRNTVSIRWDWDGDQQQYRADLATISDGPSMADYLEIRQDNSTLDMFCTRDRLTAEYVADELLTFIAREPMYQDIPMDYCGEEIEIGEYIRVTSQVGIGPNGYVDEPFVVMSHRTSPDTGQVTLTALGIKDALP